MKTKLTNLRKNAKFVYNEVIYEKCDDLNKSGYCINCKTKEKIKLPLMIQVEKYTEPLPKKKRQDDKTDNQEMHNTRLRDRWPRSGDLLSDPASLNSDRSEEIRDN